MSNKVFKIKVDRRTEFTVNEHQLYMPRWIKHFGSAEAVQTFIKNYDKKSK
jgi:hypothetical protein